MDIEFYSTYIINKRNECLRLWTDRNAVGCLNVFTTQDLKKVSILDTVREGPDFKMYC